MRGLRYGAAAVMVLAASAGAQVRLPAVIGSNMVLQAGRPIPVWGWAKEGEKVTVAVNGQSKEARADAKGRWRVTLEPMPACAKPTTVVVRGGNTLTLENVLVGQVWIGSGQSNMDRGVGALPEGKAELAKADAEKAADIRLFQVPREMAFEPADDVKGQWVVCTGESLKEFPAALYFFGRILRTELKQPVGLIGAAWAGSQIEPWIPLEAMEGVAELKGAAAKIRAGARPPAQDKGAQFRSPTLMYNAMIRPLAPYAMAGVVWYQGEAHAWMQDGMRYFEKKMALIGGWRAAWGQGDFPFYYVQLAPCYGMGVAGHLPADVLPELWEAQTMCLTIPGTGMAVTTDIADVNDIHSSRKQEVGRRLALWALAKTYGKPIECSGPVYRSVEFKGGKAYISFDHTGSGLTTSDGLGPDWFSISGKRKPDQFVPATARIEGDKVVVWSRTIAEPAAVRFAWSNLAAPNLINKEGLPAGSFRTDGALWGGGSPAIPGKGGQE